MRAENPDAEAFEERKDMVLNMDQNVKDQFEKQYSILKKKLCPFYIGPEASEEDFHDQMQDKMAARIRSFSDVGLAAIDIETCIDNSMEESMYNMRPFLLHLHGRLRKRVMKE